VHILHALFTHTHGGLGQAHVNTTEALIYKGHKVTALMHKDSPYCEKITALGAEIHTLQPRGFYDLIAAWKIRCLLKQLRPDLIIAHNARAIALLSFAARGTNIQVCGVTHSYKTPRTTHADMLVVLSDHMRKHFVQAGYKKPIEVIPNFIHLPENPLSRPTRGRVREGGLVIGAIGRFTIEKGFDIFIRALGILKQSGTNFTARLGGDGEERAKLETLANELKLTAHIQWDGWIKNQPEFYRKIDILCVPSREESFPLVVLEALSYGLPMVASDAPGPASILTHGVDGLIVPRENPEAMAAALKQLAENPGMAERVSNAAWQRAQDFGFEAVAKKWDKFISSCKTR